MHMELLDNGCLKIWMTGADLARYSLSFDAMDYRDNATREALQTLLRQAEETLGFSTGGDMLIEALPVEDGCLLLITPTTPGRRVRLRRARGPYVYRLEDTDRLLQLADGWARLTQRSAATFAGGSSLYRDGSGYRLVLYPGGSLSEGERQLLEALAQPAGEGDAAAAFTAEHGKPLAVGDALDRLLAAYPV